MHRVPLVMSCLLFLAGVVTAGQVTLVSFDSATKEVVVLDGDQQCSYKLSDKTRVVIVDPEGKPRLASLEAAVKILSNEKFLGKSFDITTEKDTITEVKFRARKGKQPVALSLTHAPVPETPMQRR